MSFSQIIDSTKIDLTPHAVKVIKHKDCFCWRTEDQVPFIYKEMRRGKLNDTIINEMVKNDSVCKAALSLYKEEKEAYINIKKEEVTGLTKEVERLKKKVILHIAINIIVPIIILVIAK